jgi:hypothetical protein
VFGSAARETHGALTLIAAVAAESFRRLRLFKAIAEFLPSGFCF